MASGTETAGQMSQMTTAIIHGNMEQVEEMLRNGFDANSVNLCCRETILMTACKSSKNEIVRTLLEFGADANKCVDGPTPLEHACLRNDIITIETLLQYNADPNTGNFSYSPLYWAVRRQNFRAFLALLSHGASLDSKGSTGLTVLHTAAKKENLEIVKSLLRSGAGANAKTENSETPIFEALRTKQIRMENIQCLLENRARVDICLNNGNSLLHEAAVKPLRNTELAYILMDFGCNVNKVNFRNETPLYLSLTTRTWFNRNAEINHGSEFSKCLIRHGAIINDNSIYKALRQNLISHGYVCDVHMMYFCIEAGLKVASLPWINEYLTHSHSPISSQLFALENEMHKSLQIYLKSLLVNPFPLAKICCQVIRTHLMFVASGSSIYLKILQLPLPEVLQNALVLEDL